MSGFDDMIDFVTKVEDDMLGIAYDVLRKYAPIIQADLQATRSYRDQTGGTRAGTVVFVVSPFDDGSAAFSAAQAALTAKHPGAAVSESGPQSTLEAPLHLVATVPGKSAAALELGRGGSRAFIAPGIDRYGPVVWAEIEARYRAYFGGDDL